MTVPELAPDIDYVTITRLAGRAISRAVQPGVWSVEAIRAGDGGGPRRVSLCRRGPRCRRAPVRWSLILRLCPRSENEPQWNVARREAAAYASGGLAALPGGLAALRCLQLSERPAGTTQLWLAEVPDDRPGRWPLHRYATPDSVETVIRWILIC